MIFFQYLFPDFFPEIIGPGIENTALTIGVFNHFCQSSVTSGKEPFQLRGHGIVAVIADGPLVDLFFYLSQQKASFVLKILRRVHWRPLEWGKRFGNKKGGTCHDLRSAMSLFFWKLKVFCRDLICQHCDLFDILQPFPRKP